MPASADAPGDDAADDEPVDVNDPDDEPIDPWEPTTEELPAAPPGRAITLTEANFDAVVRAYDTVFVYLWAEACIPCRELKPRLDDLAARWAGDVALGTLKTDDFPDLSKRNRSLRDRVLGKLVSLVSDLDGTYPTLVLYRDGNRVARTGGIDPEYDDVLDYFDDWVAENR